MRGTPPAKATPRKRRPTSVAVATTTVGPDGPLVATPPPPVHRRSGQQLVPGAVWMESRNRLAPRCGGPLAAVPRGQQSFLLVMETGPAPGTFPPTKLPVIGAPCLWAGLLSGAGPTRALAHACLGQRMHPSVRFPSCLNRLQCRSTSEDVQGWQGRSGADQRPAPRPGGPGFAWVTTPGSPA